MITPARQALRTLPSNTARQSVILPFSILFASSLVDSSFLIQSHRASHHLFYQYRLRGKLVGQQVPFPSPATQTTYIHRRSSGPVFLERQHHPAVVVLLSSRVPARLPAARRFAEGGVGRCEMTRIWQFASSAPMPYLDAVLPRCRTSMLCYHAVSCCAVLCRALPAVSS